MEAASWPPLLVVSHTNTFNNCIVRIIVYNTWVSITIHSYIVCLMTILVYWKWKHTYYEYTYTVFSYIMYMILSVIVNASNRKMWKLVSSAWWAPALPTVLWASDLKYCTISHLRKTCGYCVKAIECGKRFHKRSQLYSSVNWSIRGPATAEVMYWKAATGTLLRSSHLFAQFILSTDQIHSNSRFLMPANQCRSARKTGTLHCIRSVLCARHLSMVWLLRKGKFTVRTPHATKVKMC